MKSKLKKSIALALTAIGATSAIIQSFYFQQVWAVYVVWSVALATFVISFFLFRSAKHQHKTINAIGKILKSTSLFSSKNYTCRPARNLAELKSVWEFARRDFEDDTIPFSALKNRWLQRKDSVYCVFLKRELLGYITLWPLSGRSYERFIDGAIEEAEISSSHFTKRELVSHLYIGSIIVKTRFRKNRPTKLLLRESLRHWLPHLDPNSMINICALAHSSSGEAMLKRFGFSKYRREDETPHHAPVYLITEEFSFLKKVAQRIV